MARKGQAALWAGTPAKVMSQVVVAIAKRVGSGPDHAGNRQLSKELDFMI